MQLRVLDPTFVAVGVLDSVESVIWTERFREPGDFEIYTNYTPYLLGLLKKDYYLVAPGLETVMIIEDVDIDSDPEKGAKLKISGRSFESTLDRRIVLKQILLDGSLQTGMLQMLNENVAACEFPQRNFPNFALAVSTDPLVTSLTIKTQLYTEYVLDVLVAICKQSGIGFKITLNVNNIFIFLMYAGVDRSYGQITNPYVVFSQNFDNLIKSSYHETKRYRKNWAFIAGAEGLANWNTSTYGRWTQIDTFGADGSEGMSLREMFVDASSLATTDYETSTPIPDAEYIDQLNQIGYQELANKIEYSIFSAEVDLSRTYTYGVDFFLGDIIQFVDSYGHSGQARITEITISENLSGYSIHPTLESV